jgi:beta propeller repeat protein
MKRLLPLISFCCLLLPSSNAFAADSACAKVVLEILQELTLERVAFDAKLVLTNNLLTKDLTNVRVDVEIADGEGNRLDEKFFVATPTTTNIADVSGTGVVKASTRSEVHWLIIPSPGAGGMSADGVYYFVGATLSYSVGGQPEVIPIYPDRITVKPMPILYLDYFTPYEVIGDNPFTPQTEPAVAFPLAVRVLNDGWGAASKLKIDSAQPRIVKNNQGLLIDFRLTGASVNDSFVNPSLTVDFGTLASKSAGTAYWEMISTLSGRFEAFDVTFTHASELGGELTSLIAGQPGSHYLTHRVKVNLPGRDNRLDFLADAEEDDEHLPDTIFESEFPNGSTDRLDAQSPVTVVLPMAAPLRPTAAAPRVAMTLNLEGNPTGWIYTRMDDPSQGLLRLQEVIRADGVRLDGSNFWVEEGLDENYRRIHTLQFVDYRGAAGTTPGAYTLVFETPPVDLIPPSSRVVFSGAAVETGSAVYLPPSTRIVVTATDNEGGSGVAAMYRQVTGVDAAPVAALPFNLPAGSYELGFYSQDRAGNVETAKTLALVVDGSAPSLTGALAAAPGSFSPQAPRGVDAVRSVTFTFTATDQVPELPATLTVADASGAVVATLRGSAVSGAPFNFSWDGLLEDGSAVAAGLYTAMLSVSDGLDSLGSTDHTTTAQVTVTAAEWFAVAPLDPAPGFEQLYPAISGTRVVWQDQRNGHWDIYLKEAAQGTGTSTRLTTNAGNQEFPTVDGHFVVWQDDRNGGNGWDLYGYDLQAGSEFLVYSGAGDQTQPFVSGNWVAWQDNRGGDWDVYAKNLSTGEIRRITSHLRDQVRPALSGTLLAWEDYRHGLGEIYQLDLASGSEVRITFEVANQSLPAIHGGLLAWSDQRDGQKEIYRSGERGEALRLTYGTGDRTQASLFGNLLVYTDFSKGIEDPNLAFLDLSGGVGGQLTSHPARQEEPAVGSGLVVWQDGRNGAMQIFVAELALAELPVEVELEPGFNLVAVGQLMVDAYTSAGGLIDGAPAGLEIDHVLGYSAANGLFFEAGLTGDDFGLIQGAGLIVYAGRPGTLVIAARGEETSYALLPGTNHIGMLAVPSGYRAFDLLRSVGLANAIGVRRFDNRTGLWQSAAVRETASGPELVGNNFIVHPGEGLVVTMKSRVDGWRP